jgi:hypothetical protein
MNVAIVWGRLSSAPRKTELASGDVLVRYEVTVPRDGAPADSVPVSWVGPPKQAPPSNLDPGDEVVAVGRVRRRFFRFAAGGQGSATEVLADTVVPASRKASARRAIDTALASAMAHAT